MSPLPRQRKIIKNNEVKASLPSRFNLRKLEQDNERKREITDHRVYDEEFLKNHDLGMVWEILEHQGWTKAHQEIGNVNPDMVR